MGKFNLLAGHVKADIECAKRLQHYFQGLQRRALRHATRQAEMYNIFKEDFEKLTREYVGVGKVTYGTALDHLSRGGNVEFMSEMWEKMLDAGVAPGVLHFNAYLAACAEAGDVARAAWVLKSMRDNHVRPNRRTYTTALRLFARREDPATCDAVIASMERDSIRPDIVTMNQRVMACKDHADANAQLQRFRTRYGVIPDIKTYTAMLVVCNRSGEGDAAEAVFKRAQRDSRAVVDHDFWLRYVGAMKGAGAHEKVKAAMAAMQAAGFTPDAPVYCYFLQSCRGACEAPDDECMRAAEETFRMLVRQGVLEVPIVTQMYELYAEHGLVDRIEEMREYVSDVMNRGESMRMFEAVKRCYTAAGRDPAVVDALTPRVTKHNGAGNTPNYKFHGNVNSRGLHHTPSAAGFYRAPLRYEVTGWTPERRREDLDSRGA